MLISEGDTVVDKYFAVEQFATHFDNPSSQLVWLGSNPPIKERTTAYNMQLPELRISEGSHMEVFSHQTIQNMESMVRTVFVTTVRVQNLKQDV